MFKLDYTLNPQNTTERLLYNIRESSIWWSSSYIKYVTSRWSDTWRWIAVNVLVLNTWKQKRARKFYFNAFPSVWFTQISVAYFTSMILTGSHSYWVWVNILPLGSQTFSLFDRFSILPVILLVLFFVLLVGVIWLNAFALVDVDVAAHVLHAATCCTEGECSKYIKSARQLCHCQCSQQLFFIF